MLSNIKLDHFLLTFGCIVFVGKESFFRTQSPWKLLLFGHFALK